jgi:hypothetical protein
MECQHCDRKPVKAPQTGARLTKTTVPTYSITGLTEAHLDTLSEALSVLEDEGYDSTLLPEFTELQAMLYQTHRE